MKLYVSTYAKYNRGSLAGAWLDLNNYRNADEFAAACRRLHRDERDPELMFQDVEADPGADWQDGLYSESSIPREYWTLKAEAEAEAKRNAAKPEKGARAKEKEEQDRLCLAFMRMRGYKEEYPKQWAKDWKHWRNSYYFSTLSDGVIFYVHRPGIETRFCCGEDERGQGGEEYGTMAYALKDNAEKHTEAGFKRANLDRYDSAHNVTEDELATREYAEMDENGKAAIRSWGGRRGDVVAVVSRKTDKREWNEMGSALFYSDIVRFFTADDFARLRAAVAEVRADFVRRLDAYWKRFGASKIHTWTYWTEA